MLKINELTFSYSDKPVLDNFTLDIPAEGLTALSGTSGCGKTTLLRLIAGLQIPLSGNITGIAPDQTVILFQEDRLLPWRTVRQHISDALSVEKKLRTPKEKPDISPDRTAEDDFTKMMMNEQYWISFAELEGKEDDYPGELSGGMARRLALARCCARCTALKGKMLLLDEPFTGIDTQRRARIIDRLKTLKIPALLATHEPDVVEACDHVIRLEGPPLQVTGLFM